MINITQAGRDVIAAGSGTINTAGLTISSTSAGSATVVPNLGVVSLGAPTSETNVYLGLMAGPATFGSRGQTDASSGRGDTLAFALLLARPNGFLAVPVGYVSGSALSNNSTWDNTSIAALGLTPGTYVYTWGSGATADSLTLNIGANGTPEPGTMFLLGLGGLALALRHFRKRDAARQTPDTVGPDHW